MPELEVNAPAQNNQRFTIGARKATGAVFDRDHCEGCLRSLEQRIRVNAEGTGNYREAGARVLDQLQRFAQSALQFNDPIVAQLAAAIARQYGLLKDQALNLVNEEGLVDVPEEFDALYEEVKALRNRGRDIRSDQVDARLRRDKHRDRGSNLIKVFVLSEIARKKKQKLKKFTRKFDEAYGEYQELFGAYHQGIRDAIDALEPTRELHRLFRQLGERFMFIGFAERLDRTTDICLALVGGVAHQLTDTRYRLVAL